MITRPRNLPQADPYFDSVVLLCPLSGEDGDTTSTDLSNDANTLTFNGSAALDGDIRKFGFTSLLCDGAVTFSAQPLVDAGMATGDWTVEFWYRPDGTASVNDRLFQTRNGDFVSGIYIAHEQFNANQIGFGYDINGSTPWDYLSGGTAVTANSWYHIALVRNGSDFRLYLDGTSVANTTYAGSIYLSGSDTCVIGAQTVGSTRANSGWIENFRITSVARYTSAFTPPERAHATVKDVSADPYFSSVTLLLPLDGSDGATSTTDFSNEAHAITFNDNAQLDTAQSKFGTSSCLFDNVGDYLSIPHDVSLQPLAVSFTVECHVRFNGDPTTDWHTFVSKWGGAGAKEWWVGYRDNELNAFLSSSGSNGIFMADVAWDPAGDTWYHIAFVFDRELATNETRVYVDGTQVGASDTTLNTYSTFFNSSHDVWVGRYNADANDPMDGWIDNVRITKGVARYSNSFTPPAAPYPIS
jgi:hypothetical protein